VTPPDFDYQALEAELRQARDALLELARRLPESRAYRATSRPGWTLKHELSALAAADAELLHVLEELRRRGVPLELDLRRRRAEAMHAVQNLRLNPLLDRLEHGGLRVAEALLAQGHLLSHSVNLRGSNGASEDASEARPGSDLLRAYRDRAEEALRTLRAIIEG
jgi:hypothetical protein